MHDLTRDSVRALSLDLWQSRSGHRVGADAVLLAAAAGPPVERLVDVGAGVGAVGLGLARRWPQARADLVEIDADLAALARRNAEENGLGERVRVCEADVLIAKARRAAGLEDGAVDLVVTNPPFYESASVRVSPDAARAKAHVFGQDKDPLAAWIVAALALLKPGGRFVMIHRPDALPAIYAALGRRLGDVAVRPVYARAGEDAIRVLVAGVKGSRAPARLQPPLVLHEADGGATAEARGVHEGQATL